MASLAFQRSPAGAGTWTTVDTDTSAPYSASFDTTGVTDGLYDLRVTSPTTPVTRPPRPRSPTGGSTTRLPPPRLDDPGANLRGTVTLSSTASDAGSGIARASMPLACGAGTWTTTPAAFDTTGVTDGLYDLRVTVTDNAGNQTTSATVANRRVDNTAPAASMDDPGANLRGTVTLSSTASDGGSGIATRTYQHSPAGADTWTTTPAAFDTTAVTDGLYDLRVTVTDNAGDSNHPATVTNRRVDNTAPAAAMDDPGANLRGTVTLSSTASDAGSGIATRTYQHSPAGAGTWTTTPAAFDTTAVTDGLYDLRVIVTDNAGNRPPRPRSPTAGSTTPAPSASLTAPADESFVSATVAVSANSSDPGGSGIDSLLFERRPAGGGSWTAIDTDSSSPYSVSWDASALADGDYELRVSASDQAGNSQLSALRTVTVDNTAPGCLARRSRHAASRHRLADRHCIRSGWSRRRLRCLPALAGKRWQLDDNGHGHELPLLRLLRHDRGGGRALRPAPGRNRSGRQHDRLGPRHQPPGRQHGAHRLDGRSGRQPARHRHPLLDRQRRRLRDRHPRLSATPPPAPDTWTTTPAAFDTTAVTDGLYDLRVTVTDNAGNQTTSATVANRRVDNTAPAASMDDPGANLRGTVTLSSTASDAGSGIATRTYQHSPAGADTWTTTPAAFDTTAVTDGLYDLRVTVTDNAGNQTTSATVANRRVDNTNPTGSLSAPSDGALVSGTVAVSVTASDPSGSGVDSVLFESRPAGVGSWTAIDTDSSSPYSVSWDTSALADGTTS